METTILLIGSEYSDAIVRLINAANSTIDILMFDWRVYFADVSSPVSLINQAICSAVKRGVRVRAVLNSQIAQKMLVKNGIDARTLSSKKLLHCKAVVLDGKIAVVGSHNLTSNAMESNFELSAVIHDGDFCKNFSVFFEKLCQW